MSDPHRDVRVLGPVEVRIDGRSIDLGGPMPRKLLATLIAQHDVSVSAETLIDVLWSGSPPETARKSIQKFVWALRKALGPSLITSASGYALELHAGELDAARLETAVKRARTSVAGSDTELDEALASWRGEPYPELADTDWGPAEAARLGELRLEAEVIVIERLVTRRAYDEAALRLEAMVGHHPYRERAWALLMQTLYRSGRQAESLAAYHRLRTVLGEELGIEPSPEVQELQRRILLQDPGLEPGGEMAVPHNLPAAVTTFIGRTEELAELTGLLATTRLLTLTGPAGSGKTRLATELGRARLAGYRDHGVWFVDLAPVSSPDLVTPAIAAALDVGGSSERPTQELLEEYLVGRRTLLIIDNCEHVVGKAAEIVAALLRASGLLVVVATSRERLGIAGEAIYEVPPLPYPAESDPTSEDYDAVRLFVQRARSVSRSDLIAADQAAVGEIVRRLDGIPLAIELAAARVRSLGLTRLRDRLDDRFAVLTSPSRGGPERHQTLAAALDWSYRLLSHREQTLFARVSVFSGGFDVDSATMVCGYKPLSRDPVMDLLAELVDKSLVSTRPTAGRQRYFVLESLREFGRARLGSSEIGPLRSSHLAYFLELARSAAVGLRGPEQTNWVATLRLEHDNMRKALRWAFEQAPEDGVRLAVALGRFWDAIGPRTEGNDWLRRAVDVAAGLDRALYIDALLEAASVASSEPAPVPMGYAERALAAATEARDEMREARALRACSWAHAVGERPDEAIAIGLRALEIFERHDDRWETALCLERLGQASYQRPAWSVEMLERALRTYRDLGDRMREALTLHKIADRLAHSLDDIPRALEHAARSVAICDEIGSTHDGGHAHLEYGKVLRRAGDLDRSIAELTLAVAETTRSGDERCSVRSLTALGTSLVEADRVAEGAGVLREALTRGRTIDETHTTRTALAGLARVHAGAGRIKEAVMLLGFVEWLSQGLDLPVSDRAAEKRETERSGLRGSAGDDFDRLWRDGCALTLEDAIRLALGDGLGASVVDRKAAGMEA